MPASPGTTTLQTVLAGLAGGSTVERVLGTKHSGPVGIESVIEYRSKYPVYLNVVDWIDTFIVVTINGLDGADLRIGATPNPGEHGETPNDALYGGRTVVLTGKQYAKTIWKLRDMQQGLRGAFGEIKREYPLIFHAADPRDDLMVVCKLADKIQIADTQTTKNDFVRDFMITLRASNPRFLSVLVDKLLTTGAGAYITFDEDTSLYLITEDFSQKAGVSSGYTVEGNGYTAGSGNLLPRDLQRNLLANPRATVDLTCIKAPRTETGTASTRTRTTSGTFATAIQVATNANQTYTGIMFEMVSAVGPIASPYLSPIFGGEKLRLTGWMNGSGGQSAGRGWGVRINWRVKSDAHVNDPAPIPFTDYGYVIRKPTDPTIGGGTWTRIDVVLDVPPGQAAYPELEVYVSDPNGLQFGGTMTLLFSEMMLDFDRGVAQLYGDADTPGWICETSVKYQYPSRRIIPVVNKILNPSGAGLGYYSAFGATPSITLGTQSPAQPYTGHVKWFLITTTGSAFSLPGSGPPLAQGMGIDSNRAVCPGQIYNFSFYTRAQTVPRKIWYYAGFTGVSGSPISPIFGAPVQDHGTDGKDAVGEWRRFWANITVPADAFEMGVWVMVSTDAADVAIAAGEIHEVSAFMLKPGMYPRGYMDAAGTQRSVPAPEYMWAGTANASESLGPMAERNMLEDPDSATATTILRTGLNATVTKLASAGQGAENSPNFYRATYTGTAPDQFAQMGLSVETYVSERAPHAASMFVRLPPGTVGSRKVALEIDWFDRCGSTPNTVLDWATTAPIDIGDQWVEIKLENITAPPKANSGRVFALIINPQPGDILDADRMLLTEAATIQGWFGARSEWAEPVDVAKPDGAALRYFYSTYKTSRAYTESEQTITLTPPTPYISDGEVHLAMGYIDRNNQIFAAYTRTGKLGVYKIDNATFSTLSEVTLPARSAIPYYLRGRLKAGVLIASWYNAPPSLGNQPLLSTKYTLTDVERAKYQDAPLPLVMGTQARGGRWTLRNWTYADVTLPSGWKYYEGAGTVTQQNGKLVPLDTTRKMMVRSGLAYTVADSAITIKFRRANNPPDGEIFELGLVGKVKDSGTTYLYITWGWRDTGFGIQIGWNFGCYIKGTPYSFYGSEQTMPYDTDIWLRMVTTGNIVRLEPWSTDPVLGGTAPTGDQIDLNWFTGSVPNLLATFGTGQKGEFGILWSSPNPVSNGIDEFRMVIPTFDDIAFVKYNNGNFEAQTTIELTGPMTNPTVRNEANNTATIITGTIPTGETWVLENSGPNKRFYRKSDGANRFDKLAATSMWVTLEPNGVPNNIRLTATALGVGWDVSMTHRHTYM